MAAASGTATVSQSVAEVRQHNQGCSWQRQSARLVAAAQVGAEEDQRVASAFEHQRRGLNVLMIL